MIQTVIKITGIGDLAPMLHVEALSYMVPPVSIYYLYKQCFAHLQKKRKSFFKYEHLHKTSIFHIRGTENEIKGANRYSFMEALIRVSTSNVVCSLY